MSKKPHHVEPEPTRWHPDGSIVVDDGYRPGVEFEHPCGLGGIFYYSKPVAIWLRNSFDPRKDGPQATQTVQGWYCQGCEHIWGENEVLDRVLLYPKIMGMLQDMHMEERVYVSNGTMGDVITENVARECVKAQDFSAAAIERLILSDPNLKS